jgi:hypothetical protein
VQPLLANDESTHRNFGASVRFSLNAPRNGTTLSAARESVGASRLARRPGSFGFRSVARRETLGTWRRPSGRHLVRPRRRAALRGTHRRAGGRAIDRLVLFPDRRWRVFGPAGAVTGGRPTLRGARGSGAELSLQGERDATGRAGTVARRPRDGDPPQGGCGLPAKRPSSQGGGPESGMTESLAPLPRWELRLPRRQKCPARTRVGSSLTFLAPRYFGRQPLPRDPRMPCSHPRFPFQRRGKSTV